MPGQFAIDITLEGDADIRDLLAQAGRDAPKAALRTLNRTLGTVQTQAVRALTAETGLTSKRVRTGIRTVKATLAHLVAVLSITGKPIPLIAYGARQTRAGVTHRSGSRGRTLLAHAFIPTPPSRLHHVFLRAGRKRLPIVKQYGEALPEAAVRANILQAQQAATVAILRKNLEHEVAFLLSKRGAAPAGDAGT